jgi:hypothetical protein
VKLEKFEQILSEATQGEWTYSLEPHKTLRVWPGDSTTLISIKVGTTDREEDCRALSVAMEQVKLLIPMVKAAYKWHVAIKGYSLPGLGVLGEDAEQARQEFVKLYAKMEWLP